MQAFNEIWTALIVGGWIIVPLSILAILAIAIMIEKTIVYIKYASLPEELYLFVEVHGFDEKKLEKKLIDFHTDHHLKSFFSVLLKHRERPVWWIESRAADELQAIEKLLSKRLWVLETIVTAAPLLGLMGTIMGMMHSFQLIGGHGLVNPTGVTGGVAQALIATAIGLLIALISLFGFNYFSRKESQTLDDMERLGSHLIDHIRLTQGK